MLERTRVYRQTTESSLDIDVRSATAECVQILLTRGVYFRSMNTLTSQNSRRSVNQAGTPLRAIGPKTRANNDSEVKSRGSLRRTVKKAVMTLVSEAPFLKEVKECAYFHVRRVLRIPHESDFKVLKLIRSSSKGCYVDVGANLGQSIESILLFRPEAQIVSFEPNPRLAQKLEIRYEHLRNVRIVAYGLADSVGQCTLFVPSYKGLVCDDLASLDKESAASWLNTQTVFGFDPAALSIAEVRCEVSTLDMQQLAPIFVKVDVQGYEYNVLNGARETLGRWEPILLVEDFRGDPRTARLAEELGYEEYGFDGASLRKGSSRSDNSFLITPRRIKDLQALSPC
jgi:FkbM family methyltransferase